MWCTMYNVHSMKGTLTPHKKITLSERKRKGRFFNQIKYHILNCNFMHTSIAMSSTLKKKSIDWKCNGELVNFLMQIIFMWIDKSITESVDGMLFICRGMLVRFLCIAIFYCDCQLKFAMLQTIYTYISRMVTKSIHQFHITETELSTFQHFLNISLD